MSIKGCVTMVLAGGRGERLGALTRYYSKPAVHFGAKSRIIDFTLGNCRDSGINTIGILSQHYSDNLCEYIETAYDLENGSGGICMLPPQDNGHYYRGTADAVYRNIEFIEQFQPECVLILAGDHIYKMDYSMMVDFHRRTEADVTVASTPVPIQEAPRFGILNADSTGRVYDFEEKPKYPKSRLASMGIYVFKWDMLKKYLLADNVNEQTQHDFGRNILPEMLHAGESLYTYQFNGYWRDVGTVHSLWEGNMDQINHPFMLPTQDDRVTISASPDASYIARGAYIHQSIISECCSVFGRVEHSVLGDRVTVGEGAEVIDSVVMPGAYIGNNAKIYKTVVGTNAIVMGYAVIGKEYGQDSFLDRKICANGVSLVAPWLYIAEGSRFQAGSHICEERLQELPARESLTAHESISMGFCDTNIGIRRPEYFIRHA